jgi:hypothetical protein
MSTCFKTALFSLWGAQGKCCLVNFAFVRVLYCCAVMLWTRGGFINLKSGRDAFYLKLVDTPRVAAGTKDYFHIWKNKTLLGRNLAYAWPCRRHGGGWCEYGLHFSSFKDACILP